MKKNKINISVVIPVYKAEDCLLELFGRLVKVLEPLVKNFEIILVEDCGGDRSWEIIRDFAKEDIRFKGVQLSRNFGQHYAITAGLDICEGDWVVVMDCDLQDVPEEIPRLYNEAIAGYEVVLARRGKRKDSIVKKISSRIFYMILNYFSGINYDSEIGNFRIISRKVVQNLNGMREQLRFFGGLVDWMGFQTSYIKVQHGERLAGKSSYTFRKLFKLAIDVIVAHSDKPLRLTIGFGFIMSMVSFLYGFFIMLKALWGGTSVLGWASLMVSLYFIGGILIFSLGIIGLYLGKVFDEVKGRPLYIINEMTFSPTSKECK